jgi:putative membrane protein (TIGR04086 family)
MENKLWLKSILMGLLAIVVLLFTFSLILSIVIHFSSVQEATIEWILLPVTLITLFFGGFIAGMKSGARGWYVGGVTGTAFLFLVWLISFLGFDASLSLSNLYIYLSYLILSIGGGVVGVNMSPNRV